ncbi:hypothetical protein M405DRAFT_840352 [Rhizopogon salebrosus TDB-379]|nr:hypothetical protein M405DRAFT_840352 [Rhizopogon salebrosus TDB-379]
MHLLVEGPEWTPYHLEVAFLQGQLSQGCKPPGEGANIASQGFVLEKKKRNLPLRKPPSRKKEQRRQSDTNDITKTTTRHSSICIDGLSSTRTSHRTEGGARRRNRGRKNGGYKIDAECSNMLG